MSAWPQSAKGGVREGRRVAGRGGLSSADCTRPRCRWAGVLVVRCRCRIRAARPVRLLGAQSQIVVDQTVKSVLAPFTCRPAELFTRRWHLEAEGHRHNSQPRHRPTAGS